MASDKRPHLEDRDEPDVKRSSPLDASDSTDDSGTSDRPNKPRTTTGV